MFVKNSREYGFVSISWIFELKRKSFVLNSGVYRRLTTSKFKISTTNNRGKKMKFRYLLESHIFLRFVFLMRYFYLFLSDWFYNDDVKQHQHNK